MAKVYKNGPSKCQKHFRKSCDINEIMRKHKFNLSGLLTNPAHAITSPPKHTDFASVEDFQVNCNKVAAFKSAFELLPAQVKAALNNDPGAYVDLMYNVSNPDEAKNTREVAIELGLVPKRESANDVRQRLIAEGVAAAELKAAVQAEFEKKYPQPPK